jgi:hypothetical protein
MAVYHQNVIFLGPGTLFGAYGGIHPALGRIVFELVSKILCVGGNIGNRNHVNFILSQQALPNQGLKNQAPNAPKTINCNFH